ENHVKGTDSQKPKPFAHDTAMQPGFIQRRTDGKIYPQGKREAGNREQTNKLCYCRTDNLIGRLPQCEDRRTENKGREAQSINGVPQAGITKAITKKETV